MLVPLVSGTVSAKVRSERVPVRAPAHVDGPVFAEQLRDLEALVAGSGTAQRWLDDGLVVCFVARAGLRAQLAGWVLDANARTPSTEWRLTRNRRDELVVTLQCQREMLALVSVYLPSLARLAIP